MKKGVEPLELIQMHKSVRNKWEYIVNNNGSDEGLLVKFPELTFMTNHCAYCERFITNYDCDCCPIAEKHYACYMNHPYAVWLKNKTKENAQIMLDIVNKINPE